MNLRRPLRTSVGIWLAISLPLFIAAWFLPGGKGGDEPMWGIWREFLTHEYILDVDMLVCVVGYTLIFALPAALAGWILQFPICMAVDFFRRVRAHDDTHQA